MSTTSRPLTLPDVLEQMADSVPDRDAVVSKEQTYTYAELDERVTRLANHLLSMGVKAGDHVAVHAYNGIEWVDAFFACPKIGAVPINVNYKYLHDELIHVYENSGAVAAIVGPTFVEALGEVRAKLPHLEHVLVLGEEYDAAVAAASTVRPDVERSPDDHYIIYTGGTTGRPKGVVWRQEDIIKSALSAFRFGVPIESVEGLGEDAKKNQNALRLSTCGPMMHAGSQWVLGNCLIAGATFVLYTEPSFDPRKMLDLASSKGVQMLSVLGDAMARPIAEALLAEPDRWDMSALFVISNGASPLSAPVRDQLRQALPGKAITDSYGSSEAGASSTTADDGVERSAPRFEVGPEVQVFNSALKPCEVDEVGIFARSGPIPLGYLNDPAKTADTFVEIDGKRWVLTGDSATIGEDGSVTLLGRGSQTINSGGEKIHPEEVEGVLLAHDKVLDVGVVGTPHERWGQQVTAVVQARPDVEVDAEELRDYCRTKISNYKVPKQILLVDEVPRMATSKVNYPGVRELALSLMGQDTP